MKKISWMRNTGRKRLTHKSAYPRVMIWMCLVVMGFTLTACGINTQQVRSPSVHTESPTNTSPHTPIPFPTTAETEEIIGGDLPEIPSETVPPRLPEPSIPDPTGCTWRLVIGGLNQPLDLAHVGDGSGRIFVVEKRGMIWILQDENQLPTPFLDIRERIDSGEYERGLLGLAFHPNYVENGLFYVNYTDRRGDTTVSRFQVSSDANIADPNSEAILLQVEQPYANHNGGDLAFGPDGYLYIGLGDGGSGGDPQGNAQNYLTLLGKMLRIDVDNGTPYAIPADNPFILFSSRLGQIWATGLRNPWRFSFDRLTDDLYIGDVGQSQWEEINFLPADAPGGANFGWDFFEGFHNYEGTPPVDLELVNPIIEYSHNEGSCSVTGGYVYRGQALPEWYGVYIFGDYCSGIVWGAVQNSDGSWQTEVLFNLPYSVSSFGEDENGELYLVDFNGRIYRLESK